MKLSNYARKPIRASEYSAGFDLFSAQHSIIPARGQARVETDIAFEIPRGFYGRISSRSGLAFKHQIHVGAGIIDQDFRGRVDVLLMNHGIMDYIVKQGDRIAQITFAKYHPDLKLEEASYIDNTTKRGDNGFGSTGY